MRLPTHVFFKHWIEEFFQFFVDLGKSRSYLHLYLLEILLWFFILKSWLITEKIYKSCEKFPLIFGKIIFLKNKKLFRYFGKFVFLIKKLSFFYLISQIKKLKVEIECYSQEISGGDFQNSILPNFLFELFLGFIISPVSWESKKILARKHCFFSWERNQFEEILIFLKKQLHS